MADMLKTHYDDDKWYDDSVYVEQLSEILSCVCGRVVLYAVLCMFNCLHVVCFKIV
jgi:hypothetical protein